MRILVTHTNFPAQYRHICEHIGKHPGNQIIFLTMNLREEWVIPGVTKVQFAPEGTASQKGYSLTHHFENGARHGAGLLKACEQLKKQGFVPDIILGHSGWGQTLFVRDVFPEVPLISYFEWFYGANSSETSFDGRERTPIERAHLRTRNTSILHDLVNCQAGVTPTAWQRSQFPSEFAHKLVQTHDGINTNYFSPVGDSTLPINQLELPNTDLSGAKELVTYCSRGMEPYRGFPQFYESLPALLDARPDCHVVIVGDDRVCYSPHLPNGQSYKKMMQKKVKVDKKRVHFTGSLPYGLYKQVLQASHAHVYLTWPFVLSWSFLEAMSCGCLMVGSNTEPVLEVLRHEQNGLITDFHSPEAIANTTIQALERKAEFAPLRAQARQTILDKYCLSKCLPVQLNLISKVARDGHLFN